MLKKLMVSLLLTVIAGSQVRADLSPFEYAFNVNGELYSSSEITSIEGVNGTEFNTAAGLGTLSLTFNQAGDYSVASFFDFEVDQKTNTFFNETGSVTRDEIIPTELTYEIDEPGWQFGNIYTHFENGIYDNQIFDPDHISDDVSVGMAWNFTLAKDEKATILFSSLSNAFTSNDFFITQKDLTSDDYVTFTTSLEIDKIGGPQPVPEPATTTLLLLGSILLGVVAKRRLK